MKNLFAFVCALLALALFSCTPEGQNNPEEPIVTGTAESIKGTSAVLSGYSNEPLSSGIQFGVLVSTDSNPTAENSMVFRATSLDGQNRFTVDVYGLVSGTQYYYRAYHFYSGSYRLGQVKSFTTAEIRFIVSTLEPSRLLETEVMLRGYCQVEEPAEMEPWSSDFYFSEGVRSAEWLRSHGRHIEMAGCDEDGYFWARVYDLQPLTTYSYVACAFVEDKMAMGEVVTIGTSTVNVSYSLLEPVKATNNSAVVRFSLSIESESSKYPSSSPSIKDVYVKYGASLDYTRSETADMYGSQGCWEAKLSNLTENTQYHLSVSIDVFFGGRPTRYTFYSPAGQMDSFTTRSNAEYEAVDMGTEVKWMARNLEASAENLYGTYFAWGETSSKTGFAWGDYKWCHMESGNRIITKYNDDDALVT